MVGYAIIIIIGLIISANIYDNKIDDDRDLLLSVYLAIMTAYTIVVVTLFFGSY